MKDLNFDLQELLGKQLKSQGYDLVDVVPIPMRGDRMVRVRTLEEALDDFDDQTSGSVIGYLVQLRAQDKPADDTRRSEEPASLLASMENWEPAHDGALFSQLAEETMAGAARSAPKTQSSAPDSQADAPSPSQLAMDVAAFRDPVYTADGKLNVTYLLRNAELLFMAKEFTLARNIYRTVLQSGERSSVSLYWMGRCFEAEGRHEAAQAHYEESITYHPTLDAFQHLAALLIKKKKDQEAAELLERSLNLKDIAASTRFELHRACGNCWIRAGKLESAELQYFKALELDPASDAIQTNLGAIHLQAGKIKEAKGFFQEALASNPKNDKALSGLGSCFMALGEKRQAHDYFARSLDIELGNPTAIYYLVKLAYELKTYATAARIVGEYVQSAPVNTNLLYSLAGLQFHLGRVHEARHTLLQILELRSEHTGAKELLEIIGRYAGESQASATY